MKLILKITFIFLFGLVISLEAQDLENLGFKEKPKLSGGLSVGANLYNTDRENARQSPYGWYARGNVNLKWGILNIPVSYSLRDQKFSYGRSFNKIGLSPRYKWIKIHIGHRSMNFNKYTLRGKSFLGGGVELTPGKLRLSAFYGGIRNHLAVRDTLIYGANHIETYNRRAYGVKLGFGTSRNYVDLIYLKVKDQFDSTKTVADFNIDLDPVDNLVIGTDWRFHILKKLTFSGSINGSAYTENSSSEILNGDIPEFVNDLVKVNVSTKLSIAGDATLNYNFRNFGIGLTYQRLEPHYRSLGVPYLKADRESYTGNIRMRLFKSKFNLNIRGGLEKNNLRNLDYFGRKRVIAAVNLTIIPVKGLTSSFRFSNYQYESVDGVVEINDTLRFVNVNRSLGAFISYYSQGEDFRYGVFLNANRMTVNDLSPIASIGNDIMTLSTNLGTSLSWKRYDLSIRPSLIYTLSSVAEQDRTNYGISLNVKKGFWDKKLQANLRSRYSYNDVNDKRDGYVLSNGISLNFRFAEMHSISLRATHIKRNSVLIPSFNELRSHIGYGLTF